MSDTNGKKPQLREKILALTEFMLQYEPILVNERPSGAYRKKSGIVTAPIDIEEERNKLITLTGEAMMELRDFISAHEQLKNNYEQLRADAILSYGHLQNAGISSPDLAGAVELLVGRVRQCYDVLHNIAHNLPPQHAKEIAAKFLSRVQIAPSESAVQLPQPGSERTGDNPVPPQAG